MRPLALALLVAACTPSTSTSTSTPLRAQIATKQPTFARIDDVRVDVTLTNDGAAPRRLRVTFLTAGSLSLEVRDAGGATVHPGPPPMPPADDGGDAAWRTLAPGEAMTFTCSPAIAIDAPPGRYEIRFRGVPADDANAAVTSPWAPFTIAR